MRSYTYNLRSLPRPLAFALSLALLTSAPALIRMEGCGMMISSRNGMVVRKPLPYDAEVAWIESTGTQYIDTWLKANENFAVTTRVAWMDVSGYDKVAFGVDNGSTFSGGYTLQVTSVGAVFRFVRGDQYKDSSTPSRPAAGTFYDIEVSPDGIKINGYLAAITNTSAFATTGNLPLFAWRRGATNIVRYATVKLGPTKIYDGATLVRDFIPVRKDGVGYMYDLANPTGGAALDGLYGNAGTGAFVLPTA